MTFSWKQKRSERLLLSSKKKNCRNLIVVLSLLFLTLVPIANSSVTYTVTVTITPTHEWGGVETVQVTGLFLMEWTRINSGFMAQYFGTPQVNLIK